MKKGDKSEVTTVGLSGSKPVTAHCGRGWSAMALWGWAGLPPQPAAFGWVPRVPGPGVLFMRVSNPGIKASAPPRGQAAGPQHFPGGLSSHPGHLKPLVLLKIVLSYIGKGSEKTSAEHFSLCSNNNYCYYTNSRCIPFHTFEQEPGLCGA